MKLRIWSHLFGTFRYHVSLILVTILVLTGCFFVSGGLVLVGQNLQRVLTLWGDSLQMSVYLKEGTTTEQTENLRRRLAGDNRVGKAQWVDRAQALASFQEQMANYAPDLLKDVDLLRFIPESFQIQLSESISAVAQLDTLKSLAEELRQEQSVEEVTYGQEWVKTYATVVNTLLKAGSWIVALLVFASLFVISNAVSSSIQQRRAEIEVLELVGASKWFIRIPFLVEGMLVGALASGIALVLLGSGFQFLMSEFQSQLAFLQLSHHLQFFGWAACAGFFFSGLVVGAASAYLSLRRLNDGWSASRAAGAE